MDETDKLKARLDDLEMRYAFQQEALDTLNDVVANQWAEIDRLTEALSLLRAQFLQAGDETPEDPDQRPPHY